MTHTIRRTVTLADIDDVTNEAVAHVVKLQGIIDSVNTGARYLANGMIELTVDVDYDSAEPS